MTRSNSPSLFLVEPAFAQRQNQVRIHFLDYAVLIGALIFICGGCLFVMDLAAAHNAGEQSPILKMLDQAWSLIPSILGNCWHYTLLLIASVINSALIVAFVQCLRAIDKKVVRSRKRHHYPMFVSYSRSTHLTAKAQLSATKKPNVEVRYFLLSPVIK
jgi:hypothetical protein